MIALLQRQRDFCERTCRVAVSLGWSLEETALKASHTFTFHAPNGTQVAGETHADRAQALHSACRKLAERLI